ncbi:MAG: hypothetical protein U9R14_00665 [Patescibacteria group bacterium]|nr:hypothetical protein [Patescibacteria group bacterium]
MSDKMSLKQAVQKSLQVFKSFLLMMFGILLLINLINLFVRDYYSEIFTGNLLLDPLVGALAGSFSFGMPITSYILGGELLSEGISLLAITSFILTWTTVGMVMLPLEMSFLGKRFALVRNGINFIFSILISILVIFTLNVL